MQLSDVTSSAKILIVDDDADIRQALDGVLGDLGYETRCCASGIEALHAIDSADFDVIVTDMRMPTLDGIALCERIARNHNVPVIVMTAFGETQAAVDALRADAVDFIVKPFSTATVAEAVRRAVALGRERRPVKRLPGIVSEVRNTINEEEASLDHLQREHIDKVLRAVGGNKAEAARVLGIDRATLYRRMKRFGWERTG